MELSEAFRMCRSTFRRHLMEEDSHNIKTAFWVRFCRVLLMSSCFPDALCWGRLGTSLAGGIARFGRTPPRQLYYHVVIIFRLLGHSLCIAKRRARTGQAASFGIPRQYGPDGGLAPDSRLRLATVVAVAPTRRLVRKLPDPSAAPCKLSCESS
jgi:hypothetical protein